MPTTCVIEFHNNPAKVFYSGQLMIGTIHLNLTKTKTVRGVYLKIKGKGETRWSEGSGDDETRFGTTEEYLNTKTYFVGSNSGSTELRRGSYSFSFQTPLPVELPTSFQGKYGFVRYHAVVVVDVPFRPDNEFETPFTIIKHVDLNAFPALRQPLVGQTTASFWFTGPIRVSVSTPVSGYTAGQTINFAINVDNTSNKLIPKFKVKFVNNIAYHKKRNSSKKKKKDIVLVEAITGKCDPKTKGTYHVNLQVPPVPPTEENSIIKLRYTCIISCTHTDDIILPVVIGAIPIMDLQEPTAPPNVNTHRANENRADAGSPIQFPNDELPTYEEATRELNVLSNDFVPKYPCFKRQTSYSNSTRL